MAIILNGRYTVSSTDGHRIMAIANYNQLSSVTSIQFDDGEFQPIRMPLAELPAFIKKNQSKNIKTFTFTYTTSDSYSLHGIFPEIIASEKQRKLASQQRSEASVYLDEILNDATQLLDIGYIFTRPELKSITREEARNLVLGTPDVAGAIEFPDLNMIVLQTGPSEHKAPAVIYIKYGEQWSIDSIPLCLDIDEGFGFYMQNNNADKREIHKKLQACFSSWKSKNYQDEFMPKEHALDFAKEELCLISSVIPYPRLHGRGFFLARLDPDYIRHADYYHSVTEAVNTNNAYDKTIELLKDYTKSNSVFGAFFGRVLHGAWNRNHLDEVDQICNTSHTVQEVLEALDKIPLNNKTGALARRIEFIRMNYANSSNSDPVKYEERRAAIVL